ncbi:2-oxoglutarate and iron-dependent oxygenase JMJD4 [Planococcus citri]|uniref:2-oxoglutarate and iron-dependent oxygenase JMJD4 n=1 Tax=Planococcus citri TaxID=170843 RepID=UPI0031F7B9BA
MMSVDETKLIEIDQGSDILRRDGASNHDNNNIDHFDGDYNEFFNNHLLSNTPCIIRNSTKRWKCSSLWVKNCKPDIDYLNSKYGEAEVPVANCNEKYFNAQSKCCMKFSQFADYWKKFIENGYPSSEPCLYLKDWHFTRDYPDENVYTVPSKFSNDWLNEYYTANPELKDDYRFVYIGPKHSWTPFHADVFTSYSWSVNVCGEKKWILLPPGEEQKMKDKTGELPYSICEKDCDNLGVTYLIVFQKAGDALFVPSGWHHQVWNLMDTISINHNWINGCNIDKMWLSMKRNLDDVQKEISCFKDTMDNWHSHCQLILKSCFGMDFEDFYKLIMFILKCRKSCVDRKTPLNVYGGWVIGPNHLNYDYLQVRELMESFLNEENVKSLLKEKTIKDSFIFL